MKKCLVITDGFCFFAWLILYLLSFNNESWYLIAKTVLLFGLFLKFLYSLKKYLNK